MVWSIGYSWYTFEGFTEHGYMGDHEELFGYILCIQICNVWLFEYPIGLSGMCCQGSYKSPLIAH